MTEQVELPWLDEPVEIGEAVELIAQADEDDEETIQQVREEVDNLEQRVDVLEDSSSVECPACGSDEGVHKAGVGAAKLVAEEALSEKNVDALDRESHVCLDCQVTFTPAAE